MRHPELDGKRVLVVEDEWLVAMQIRNILTDAGCIVVGPFSQIMEAAAAAKVEAIDLALLDLNVAGETAIPVAHILAERGVPFLFLTGSSRDALPRDQPNWEAYAKPFDSDQLAARLVQKLESSLKGRDTS